jgi:uncharacterized membrane protein
MRDFFRAITTLTIIGAADATYGIVQHFGPTGSGPCNWGGRISCDIVNKSVFSEIAGIPVAVIGLFGYVAIFAAAFWVHKTQKETDARNLFLLVLGGFLFSAYLTWIEVWWLRAVCPICIVSQTVITLLLILASLTYRKMSKENIRPVSQANLS